jgi:Protein of unknown function (DUF2971)
MTLTDASKYRSPNRRHERQLFYKYMTPKVAKIVLASRQLRWSSPLLFNDPFDVTQELRLNFDEAKLIAALTDRVASLLERGDSPDSIKHPVVAAMLRVASCATRDKRRAMAKELRKSVDTSAQIASLAILKDKWKEMVPTFRVLCLSELNDVTPMWQHYADGYKGVVLEFSVIDELESALLMARPIIYQDTPPSIADVKTWVNCLLAQSSYWDIFTEYQYVKTNPWSYEREWRIVSGARPGENGLFGDYGFQSREFTGIYFGPKCCEEDRTELVALLTDGLEHVLAYEAFPDTKQAKFVFVNHRSLNTQRMTGDR